MRAFTNYKDVQAYANGDSEKLPAGAYEVTLKRAEDTDKALCLLFDISEGEYSGYFMRKFEQDKQNYPDKARYKGVLRLWYPNGGQYDAQAERRMKTALERITESNHLKVDFTKEWDGAVLKGAKVGMIFRDQEYSYNGYTGMTAQPYQIITLEDLREGRFTLPEPKKLGGISGDTFGNTFGNTFGGTSGGTNHAGDSDSINSGYAALPADEDLPF